MIPLVLTFALLASAIIFANLCEPRSSINGWQWVRRLRSYLIGRPIGTIAIEKNMPFRIGNPTHFLPEEMWTEAEHKSLKFSLRELVWNGAYYEFSRDLLLNKDELKVYFDSHQKKSS